MKNKLYTLGCLAVATFGNVAPALAQVSDGSSNWKALGGGIAIGLAALGGGLGQAKAVSAALEATGRNPSASGKLFVPMILGLVFIETLVIFSFVIALKNVG